MARYLYFYHDLDLSRPKVKNLKPLKFNEFERDSKKKLTFHEEVQLSYSIKKLNQNEEIENKIIDEISQKGLSNRKNFN